MVIIEDKIKHKAMVAQQTLSRLGPVRAIYLFGSQIDGRADKWSDIDLAAFLDGVENWDFFQVSHATGLVMKEAGVDVEAHFFPSSQLDHPEKGSFADYILKHGVRIYGED
jgi:predicted nucleotidyltransferase